MVNNAVVISQTTTGKRQYLTPPCTLSGFKYKHATRWHNERTYFLLILGEMLVLKLEQKNIVIIGNLAAHKINNVRETY